MYIHGPVYDIDALVCENLHIHTTFSRCAAREMTVERIVAALRSARLDVVALTDHYHPFEKGFTDKVDYLKSRLSRLSPPCRVLVGGELSSYDVGRFSDTDEENAMLDYRLYACNHYHQSTWVHPDDRSLAGYIDRCFENLDALLRCGRADCTAHPFIGKYIIEYVNEDVGPDPCAVTAAFDDERIAGVMELAMRSETAWELNIGAVLSDPVFHRRFFNLGRELGAVFNLGTDAHALNRIDSRQYAGELKKILL